MAWSGGLASTLRATALQLTLHRLPRHAEPPPELGRAVGNQGPGCPVVFCFSLDKWGLLAMVEGSDLLLLGSGCFQGFRFTGAFMHRCCLGLRLEPPGGPHKATVTGYPCHAS